MEQFPSQQAALRSAFNTVLGTVPKKGELVITDEQRMAVGELMIGWLREGLWSIKDGTRAAAEPMLYITGKRPTDLIQAWVKAKKKENVEPSGDEFLAKIKMALDAGLISKEQAADAAMKHLGLAS